MRIAETFIAAIDCGNHTVILLLFCYCRSEKDCDPEMNIPNTEDFLENIRQNWGTYLANSLRDLEKNE